MRGNQVLFSSISMAHLVWKHPPDFIYSRWSPLLSQKHEMFRYGGSIFLLSSSCEKKQQKKAVACGVRATGAEGCLSGIAHAASIERLTWMLSFWLVKKLSRQIT